MREKLGRRFSPKLQSNPDNIRIRKWSRRKSNYAHRRNEVTRYKTELQGKYAFMVFQPWDREAKAYK
jgi:hypothetical protein